MRNRLPVLKRAEASRSSAGQFGRYVNLYRVLGLRPDADGKEIKAAYVRLIKQVHPDFNAGDAQAEQRTKQLNRAYQTLGKTDTRAAYDTELARQHTEARRCFLQSMVAGVAAFVMTIGLLIPLATFLERKKQANPQWQTTEAYAPAKHEQIEAKSNTGLESVYARELSSSFPPPLTTSLHLPQQGYRVPLRETKPLSLDIEVQEGDKGFAPPLPREEEARMLSSELAITLPGEMRAPAAPLPEGSPRIRLQFQPYHILFESKRSHPNQPSRHHQGCPQPGLQLGQYIAMRTWASHSNTQRMSSY